LETEVRISRYAPGRIHYLATAAHLLVDSSHRAWRFAMCRLSAVVILIVLPMSAAAAGPVPNVKETINRGLTFLAKDNLAWKEKMQCAECHHAPFTIWALNEGKKQGYTVDDKALADLTSWVVTKDHLAKLVAKPLKREQIEVNEAPLLLALGIEAGDARATQEGLRKMLASVLSDQDKDGSWKLSYEFRPIGSSPQTLTTLALLALSAPNAPEMGKEGKVARERGLKWLRDARPDEVQAAALRLILWRRLKLPATEWEPLVEKLRAAQNADGGWSQIEKAKSDAYTTGQVLYALAEVGVKPGDEAVRKAQSFLSKTQRQDGAWTIASRAIMRDGKPPKNLEPITHAGSAWAVLGLVRSSPDAAEKAGSP
jgi:Squalene-hopene cyclase C-terminal domain/Prenyltransferase and squalene oxidase repeat